MSRKLAVALIAAGLIVWAGYHALPEPERDSPAAPTEAAARFVGRESCAACHQEELDLWTGSHHDLAMQPATAETVLGDFDDASFDYASVTTRFHRRDGRFFVTTDGPDGELADFEIRYTFGVHPLQQYLIELPRGRMQAFGIAWDSRPEAAGGQRWFHLYPDEEVDHEDVLHWTRPAQNWNFMCAECHSTDFRKGYDAARDGYESRFSEIDVSCEACHGPGSDHLAWAEGGGSADDGSDMGLQLRMRGTSEEDWTANPNTGTAIRTGPLPSTEQIDACARCHSRRSVINPSYRHGQSLFDSHRPSLLEAPAYHADGQIEGEVYVWGSFVQSRMHVQGVVCSDCHDPHSLELKAEGNALCSRCHEPERFDVVAHHHHEPGGPGSACVDCHMPAKTYMGVDPRRDHSMRVPRPDLALEIGTPDACSGCHADRSVAWAAEAAREWWGDKLEGRPHFAATIQALREGKDEARPMLAALLDDALQPPIARATALALAAGILSGAIDDRIRGAVADRDALVRLGALAPLESSADPERIPLLTGLLDDPVRAVRIEALRVLLPLLARLPAELEGTVDRVMREYRESLEVNADRAASVVNLGNLELALGRPDASAAAYERALRLDSDHVPAIVNLADLRRGEGREADALRLLEEGVRRVSDSGSLHHALGLALVRAGRRERGLQELETATRLEPEAPRLAYVYGVALHSTGAVDEALGFLGRAQERHPRDVDILVALVTMSRDRGRIAEARRYARKLVELRPDDAGLRGLLDQLR